MAEITKDLNYYLQPEHADEMPTDIKMIEKLANEHMQAAMDKNEEGLTVDRFVATDTVAKDERSGASSDAEAKVADEAKAAAEAAQKVKDESDAAAKAAADAEALKATEVATKATESKPEGILAKDGKHIIPFAALSTARERADAAERLAQKQAEELLQLRAQVAGIATAQGADETGVLTDGELLAIAEDSPTLAKILKAQQETIKNLNESVQNLATHATQQIVNAETEAKSAVQEAIDANPTLAAWQNAEDQTRWDEAARLDKALRESPLWKDKPFDERFAKVVEITNATFGDVVKQVQEVKQPTVASPTEAEIRAAAEEKLAEKTKTALPVSLSHIPGGTPPAVDEHQRVEQMSSVELGSKFLGMSKDQLDLYLAAL